MENDHTLVSIFRAHPLHPFSRHERAVVLFCNLCAAYFFAALEATLDPAAWTTVAPHVAITCLLSPLCLAVWGKALASLATCKLVQGDHVPVLVRRGAEALGRLLLCNMLCASVLLVLIGTYAVTVWPGPYTSELDGGRLCANIATATVLGWVYEVPTGLVIYGLKRWCQTRGGYHSLASDSEALATEQPV